MSKDRSLEEFLSAGSESDSDAESAADDSAPGPDGSPPDASGVESEELVEEKPSGAPEARVESASDVEPIDTTYASSPDGGECAACGETADARWRDGEDLVCRDCKNW